MIHSREQLIHVLTEAAEVEHNLLCSYLYAAFSLKRAGEPGLTEPQGEAVERWRKAIIKVALEEMAHLACVNNLLTAVGGAPHFDRPNFPVAPGYLPAEIVVRLTPFDHATLDHFIFLERPDSDPIQDAPGFEAEAGPRVAGRTAITPGALDYRTIGELYDALSDGFATLADRLGEAALIEPSGRGQLDESVVRLPGVQAVTTLAVALATIRHIKEQGEGSTSDSVESHFDRFQAIRTEWRALAAEDSGFAPAWPAAHDPVMRRPAPGLDRVWITDPIAAAHLDLGNALYGAMLSLMAQAFSVADRATQVALINAGVEAMEASAAVATALARLPAGPDHPGVNAGLSFAVPRNLGRRPTGSLAAFAERLGELRTAAEQVLEAEPREKALRRLTNALGCLSQDPAASTGAAPKSP